MPTIVYRGNAGFSFDGATVNVDVACDMVALEITADTEMIDIGTMCEPGAQDVGRTTYSAVLTLLPTMELHDELSEHIGEAGAFGLSINPHLMPGVNTGRIQFQTRFSALPWGRFEVGQRVEADWPLAVLSDPEWIPIPTTPLAAEGAAPEATPAGDGL